jgi:hypothetical protein
MRLVKIYIIVLCWFCKTGIAQFYFNNRYDTFGSCDGAAMVDTFNNQYLTAGFTCSSVSFYAMNLRLYNQNGVTNINKTYHWSGNNFQNGKGFVKNGNKYLLPGTRYYKNDTSLVFQWLFDTNLDSIKYTEYGYLNQGNVILKMIDYNQKNYFMVGYVYDNLYNSDVLLIKTDTSGNEIWKKKIGLAGWDEYGWGIKMSSDDKLLISGNKRVHNGTTNGAYILKVDTSGAVMWQQHFPSNQGLAATALVELPNTDIVAIAGKGYGGNTRMELIKLDAAGNLIFDKEYGSFTDRAEPYAMIMNDKGNLVAVGQNYYPSMGGKVNGLMYEFNQNGDSLFSREYAIQPGSQNYFRDVVQPPDKGYCFSGFISPLFANGGTGNQDIWLLKTDSTFCESAVSCGYPTSVSKISNELGDISIYPNPANSIINIVDEFNQLQNATIQIKNYLGQLVFSSPFVNQVNLQSLSAGMYFLTIDSNFDKKVIKIIKD